MIALLRQNVLGSNCELNLRHRKIMNILCNGPVVNEDEYTILEQKTLIFYSQCYPICL